VNCLLVSLFEYDECIYVDLHVGGDREGRLVVSVSFYHYVA